MRSISHLVVVCVCLSIYATSSSAAILATYRVSDATGEKHGLWTSSSTSGLVTVGNSPFWSINGLFSIIDDDSAVRDMSGAMDGVADYVRLVASATNENGIDVADIDLTFYTPVATASQVKNGGGGVPSTWDFFSQVIGDIEFSTGVTRTINKLEDQGGQTALQIGFGANDKYPEFGASAWVENDLGTLGANHWDLNLKLSEVPEPSTVAIWGFMAIVGLFYTRSRKN